MPTFSLFQNSFYYLTKFHARDQEREERSKKVYKLAI